MVIGETMESLSQDGDIEVEEEPYGTLSDAQVGKQLGIVQRKQFLDGLHFHDDFLLHQQIEAIGTVKFQPTIAQQQRFLLLYCETSIQ